MSNMNHGTNRNTQHWHVNTANNLRKYKQLNEMTFVGTDTCQTVDMPLIWSVHASIKCIYSILGWYKKQKERSNDYFIMKKNGVIDYTIFIVSKASTWLSGLSPSTLFLLSGRLPHRKSKHRKNEISLCLFWNCFQY